MAKKVIDYAHCVAASERMNEARDCGVRAVAIAAQIPYEKAHGILSSFGRVNRKGTQTRMVIAAITLYVNWYVLIRGINYSGKTVHSVVSELSKEGVFLVKTTNHFFVIRGGAIQDWITEDRRHRVTNVWAIF